jgi:TetR/AcrR family transcriptional regulator, cholesterol catabolism regulator
MTTRAPDQESTDQPPTMSELRAATSSSLGGPKSQATREALIVVGLDLFFHNGYRQTTIQQIVDASGLTKGAFYHHFTSKDDLLLIAHETYLEKQLDVFRRVVDQNQSPSETLRIVIAEMVRGVLVHRAELALFLEERRSLQGPRFENVRRLRHEFELAFTDLINAGVESGDFTTKATESGVIALGLLGMVSWTYQWIREDGPHSPDKVAELLSSMVLDGLLRRNEASAEGGRA